MEFKLKEVLDFGRDNKMATATGTTMAASSSILRPVPG